MNLAILTGKLIGLGLRMSGRRGSALPGLVVERFFPKTLATSLNSMKGGVVIVTGSNGKTSTTKVLAEMYRANDIRVLTDSTGSNMTRGLLSLIIKKSKWNGQLPYEVAVLEVDEAYSAVVARQVKPRALLVLNIHRDQMDRYGEIDKTAAMIAETAAATSELVVLNGLDRQMSVIAEAAGSTKIEYFGCASSLIDEFPDDEELYPEARTSTRVVKDGDFRLLQSGPGGCEIEISGQTWTLHPRVPGGYNHLNITAALGLFRQLNDPTDEEFNAAIRAVEKLEPAFGRGESVKVGSSEIKILLVKNPGGFRQALKLVDSKYEHIDIIINDGYADGRDVSWLWDVDFSALKGKAFGVAVAGDRSHDMALRLKYDDVDSSTYDSIAALVNNCTEASGQRLIFATYTAMLALRSKLAKVAQLDKVL